MTDWKNPEIAECPLLAGGDHAERLLDYANRKLAPELSLALEAHAAGCPACEAFVASQREVWTALDNWEAAEISDDFDRRLWARIEHEERAPWYVRAWNRMTNFGQAGWRPVVPVAAVLLLAVGLWMKPAAVPNAAIEPGVDADQLETALEDMEMLRQLSPAVTPTVQHM
jgi:hypothetical protein